MCLSVVITGPICLFNGGNIIASLQSVFYGTRGLHMLQLHCDWRDATDLHGIRAALQPKCLFTHTFNSDRVRRVKAEEAGGPPPSRAEQSRAEQRAGDDMCQTGTGPRFHTALQRESLHAEWADKLAGSSSQSVGGGCIYRVEYLQGMNGLLYAPQNMVFIMQKKFWGVHFVPCPLQKYRR